MTSFKLCSNSEYIYESFLEAQAQSTPLKLWIALNSTFLNIIIILLMSSVKLVLTCWLLTDPMISSSTQKMETLLPLNPIYSLSVSKIQSLQDFLDKQLNIRFIHLSCSSYGVPIKFIQKDSPLYLCFDFHSINKIITNNTYCLEYMNEKKLNINKV